MAVTTVALAANSLKRVYDEPYFQAVVNAETPILNDLEECEDKAPLGAGFYHEFNLATPGNVKTGAEGQSGGSVSQRVALQGVVAAVEFVGIIQLTEFLKNAGTGVGAFGDELNREMEEVTEDMAKFMQILYSLSHGTGRLGIVEADTSSATTFVAANPEGVVGLRENWAVDIYDADSSGSAQVDSGRVASIDYPTRTVTLAAAASLTAGWGVYKEDSYGYAPNGIRGLVDDGTYAASIHGQSRSSYPALKSRVIGSHSNVIDLTEDQMRRMMDQLRFVGGEVDAIRSNVGVFNAFMKISDGNRRWQMGRGGTAKRVMGHSEGDAVFAYYNSQLPIKVNVNLPGREMYFLSLKKSFRKHTLRKLGWFFAGDGGSPLLPTPGTNNYLTSHTGLIVAQQNISNRAPRWNGVIRGIKDTSVAGDAE